LNRSSSALAISALLVAALATSGCKPAPKPRPATSAAASTTAPAAAAAGSPATATAGAAGATGAVGGDRTSRRAARQQLRAACKDDLAACQTASAGERPMRCLRRKLDQLKPDCKAAMQTFMAARRNGGGGGRRHGGMGRGGADGLDD
jgi:hypothetical protein